MGSPIEEQFIKQVVASTAGPCGTCSQPFDVESISVLGHQEELWFLSLSCAHCRTQGLVAAMIKNIGDIPIDVNSADLGIVEPDTSVPLTTDDVVDLHAFLDGFDGDFQRLFTLETSDPATADMASDDAS